MFPTGPGECSYIERSMHMSMGNPQVHFPMWLVIALIDNDSEPIYLKLRAANTSGARIAARSWLLQNGFHGSSRYLYHATLAKDET